MREHEENRTKKKHEKEENRTKKKHEKEENRTKKKHEKEENRTKKKHEKEENRTKKKHEKEQEQENEENRTKKKHEKEQEQENEENRTKKKHENGDNRNKKKHEKEQEQEAEGTKKKNNKRKKDNYKANTTVEEEEPEPEPERFKAKVQFIPEQHNKTPPLVGYFPSIYKPNEDPDEEKQPRVRVYRNTNEKKNRTGRMELVVSPRDSSVEYVGTSYSGEAMTPQFCHYAVGVLDKTTQTLKIVPIAANKIFRLEPRVGGSDVAGKEAGKEEISEEVQANMKAMLDTRYGTKKSLRQSRKMNALNKENDPESQKDLALKMKSVKINKEALASTTSETVLNVPSCDVNATTPQQAYPLDKIILKGEWDFLQDIYKLLSVGSEVTDHAYPSFVCNRIHKLRESQDDVEKQTLASIFSYITHLVKFKDQHSMDGRASAKNHRIPNILYQKFMTMFFDAESKRLSDDNIHLLISYVLVLSLHADDFRTNPTDIAKDLRMSEVKLRDHFEKLGCKLSREKNLLYATLPVPLQFPKAKQRRRR